MTERLKQLLDGEALGLDVPPPATDAVLHQGRGLRRRNRLTVAGGAVAAAIIVGGSAVALTGSGGGDSKAGDPAVSVDAPAVGDNAVFSYGNHVFYDGPAHEAVIDDQAVKSLYYTSAGVLVRHGNNPWSDGGGPQRFSLVTPDGSVQRLGLVTEETVHATDSEQPYVAYGEAVDGELQVVVYDVAADAEVARVDVAPTTEGWFPVAIDGPTVYVQNGYDGGTLAVDWEDGTVTESDLDSLWEVGGGRMATEGDGAPAAVVDLATGEELLTADGPGSFDLSPDGRYVQFVEGDIFDAEPDAGVTVYDVETGESVSLEGDAFGWGWTADGDLFRVGKDTVTTCDPASGECTDAPYEQPAKGDAGGGPQPPELKLGGTTYES